MWSRRCISPDRPWPDAPAVQSFEERVFPAGRSRPGQATRRDGCPTMSAAADAAVAIGSPALVQVLGQVVPAQLHRDPSTCAEVGTTTPGRPAARSSRRTHTAHAQAWRGPQQLRVPARAALQSPRTAPADLEGSNVSPRANCLAWPPGLASPRLARRRCRLCASQRFLVLEGLRSACIWARIPAMVAWHLYFG